jgi:hypothetical protein
MSCPGAGSTCQQGACACRRQSIGNRLFNAGFDTSLDGWKYDSKAKWSSMDADSCPGSGSVSFNAADAGAIASDCFSINAGEVYNFGARIIEPPTSMYHAYCQFAYYTGDNCMPLVPGDGSLWESLMTIDSPTWQTAQTTVTIPDGMHSGAVNCGPAGSGGTGTFYFDQLYLTKAPGRF